MFIEFPRGRYFVRPSSLHRYLTWRARSGSPDRILRRIGRSIQSPRLRRSLPIDAESAIDVARAVGLHSSWIRYPKEATRILMFDAENRLVGRVPRDTPQVATLREEAEIRRGVEPLAPEIVDTNIEGGILVEEWIEDVRAGTRAERPDEWVEAIADSLYEPVREPLPRHLDTLLLPPDCRPIQELKAWLEKAYVDLEVPVGTVHGDLSPANLYRRRDGSPVIADWEYTGERLISYDAWYHRQVRNRQEDLETSERLARSIDAIERFTASVSTPPLNVDSDVAFAIHLLERSAIRYRVKPESPLPRTLRDDAEELLRNASQPGATARRET